MSVQIAALHAKVTAETAEGERGLERFDQRLRQIGTTLTGLGTRLALGLTLPLVGAGTAALGAASDLDESLNKVQVVFGETATAVVAFSETSAEALGLTQQQALAAAGTFGNLFTAMGLGQGQAAQMSQELLTLAADLASFNNIDPAVALEKLRAGLVGEVEPLRALGVNLSAAAVEAKAFELGLAQGAVSSAKLQTATVQLEAAQRRAADAARTHGAGSLEARQALAAVTQAEERLAQATAGSNVELTAAQKAQAAYALILEQTTNAQGDFARTAGGLANATRILKAQLGDAAATLGQQLLPYALQGVQALSGLVEKFTNLDPATQKAIVLLGGAAAALGPLLLLAGGAATALGGLAAAASGPLLPALAGVVAVGGLLALTFDAVTGAIGMFQTGLDSGLTPLDAFKLALSQLVPPEIRQPLFAFIDGFTSHFGDMQASMDGFVRDIQPKLAAAWTGLKTLGGELKDAFDALGAALGVGNGAGLIKAFGDLAGMYYEFELDVIFGEIKLAVDAVTWAINALVAAIQWLKQNGGDLAVLLGGYTPNGTPFNAAQNLIERNRPTGGPPSAAPVRPLTTTHQSSVNVYGPVQISGVADGPGLLREFQGLTP